jgi:hypothetical protein
VQNNSSANSTGSSKNSSTIVSVSSPELGGSQGSGNGSLSIRTGAGRGRANQTKGGKASGAIGTKTSGAIGGKASGSIRGQAGGSIGGQTSGSLGSQASGSLGGQASGSLREVIERAIAGALAGQVSGSIGGQASGSLGGQANGGIGAIGGQVSGSIGGDASGAIEGDASGIASDEWSRKPMWSESLNTSTIQMHKDNCKGFNEVNLMTIFLMKYATANRKTRVKRSRVRDGYAAARAWHGKGCDHDMEGSCDPLLTVVAYSSHFLVDVVKTKDDVGFCILCDGDGADRGL